MKTLMNRAVITSQITLSTPSTPRPCLAISAKEEKTISQAISEERKWRGRGGGRKEERKGTEEGGRMMGRGEDEEEEGEKKL